MVPSRQHNVEPLPQQFFTNQAFATEGERSQCKINSRLMKSLQQYRGDLFHNAYFYLRVFHGKTRKRSGKKIRSDCRDSSNHHATIVAACHLLNFKLGRSKLPQDGFCPRQESPSEMSQARGTTEAIE